MARFSFLLAFAIGTVLCLSAGQSRASPLPNTAEGVAQIPNMPSPGDFPRPPGMAHSRRARRDAHSALDESNADAFTDAQTYKEGTREKRAAKGTGGKLPSKAG
uniref:Uncharacterized protein n=1 Tax=Anopheles albimanus TaxID=7167 RepID=A0A182FTH0_ANOAL